MKPSEFWAQIFALPEQARQAEGEAAELRIRADALTAWAKQATSAHRDALFAADAEEMGRAVEILNSLPTRPDAVTSDSPADAPAPLPEKTRKQRSDAGKPRGRKTDGASDTQPDESAPANPADVKSEDAARVRCAGLIRKVFTAAGEPMTIAWIMARTGLDKDDVRSGLKLLSLVSWRMQREGDSQPVEVWGTVEQFAQSVGRMSVKSGDRIADTIANFGCGEFDAKRVWKLLDPMRSP